jgi:diguanylate cyclase (GGDEF)-like protein
VRNGKPEIGVEIILTALYFAVAFCYWRHYGRTSAGVMTAVGGFLLWGAVFPAGVLVDTFAPSANIAGEVWNIPKYLVAVGMILTLLEDQIRTSNYFGYHDELTSVPNRRLLEDRLEQSLAYARRSKTKVAVLQLDLDRFKEVNDTYGHPVGDKVLREVVARLSACIRLGDTLARSGGDEFTVVSDVANMRAAEELAASLERALSPPISLNGHEIQTGLSIGIALFPDDGLDPDQLHSAADRAMYTAKRATRNTTSVEVGRPVSA